MSTHLTDWVKIEDNLPDFRPGYSHSEDVNILLENNVVSTGSYSHMHKEWADYIYNNRFKVIAWTSLPKPPEE